jgi:hypothetical protein
MKNEMLCLDSPHPAGWLVRLRRLSKAALRLDHVIVSHGKMPAAQVLQKGARHLIGVDAHG